MILVLLCFFGLSSSAWHRYHVYLVSQVYRFEEMPRPHFYSVLLPTQKARIYTPEPFQRPKGAIFCRMEDYLTIKTKVWIKVGVK